MNKDIENRNGYNITKQHYSLIRLYSRFYSAEEIRHRLLHLHPEIIRVGQDLRKEPTLLTIIKETQADSLAKRATFKTGHREEKPK